MRTWRSLLRRLNMAAGVVPALLGGTAGLLALGPMIASLPAEMGTVATAQTGGSEPLASASALGEAFSQVSERALPSVVTISSERVVSIGDRFRGTPFDDFFDFFGPRGRDGHPREFRQRGLGSGFIVSTDGVILTSSHVVHDTENIRVVLTDDREFEAEVVGTDPETDVAVLRIDADGPLPALPLGDSDRLRTGEWVLALGNPFGMPLQGTVTAGIISAKGRSRIGLANYEDFIQTDAAINPGNSGGPLVNLHGEVIGINTAIASRSGGYQGVGFAIPIDLARSIMRSLIDEGRVVRGWLGVYIQDLNESLRDALGSDVRGGALVSEVMEDSPADRAGIEAGDILIAIDDRQLEDVDDLRLRVAETPPNSDVTFTILRDGKELRLEVEIAERQAEEALAAEESGTVGDLGFEVEELDDEWRVQFDLDDATAGVVVTEVERDSPAARAGLRPGSVIVEADRREITSARDLRRMIDELEPGDTLLLYVITETARRFVAIPIPE